MHWPNGNPFRAVKLYVLYLLCEKGKRGSADPTKIRGEQICGGVVIYSRIVL